MKNKSKNSDLKAILEKNIILTTNLPTFNFTFSKYVSWIFSLSNHIIFFQTEN